MRTQTGRVWLMVLLLGAGGMVHAENRLWTEDCGGEPGEQVTVIVKATNDVTLGTVHIQHRADGGFLVGALQDAMHQQRGRGVQKEHARRVDHEDAGSVVLHAQGTVKVLSSPESSRKASTGMSRLSPNALPDWRWHP